MTETFYQIVTRELKQLGFSYRQAAKGSHQKWMSRTTGKTLSLPYHLKSRHTANNILKGAGSQRRV